MIRTAFVAPSASVTMSSASFMQASVSTSVRSASDASTPTPLARTITVSFVEVAPSTSIELNEGATAAVSARCNVAGSVTASVVRTQSMVAISGANIAAPLAMPPTVTPSRSITTSLAKLSVVMMAVAARLADASSVPRVSASTATPGRAESSGNGMPMRPVWQISTSVVGRPIDVLTSLQSAWQDASPSSPVAAFAFPEVSSTALATDPLAARCARLVCTGAAGALFCVKTAAATAGVVDTTRAASGTPEALMPTDAPVAEKPAGAVTLMGTPPQ